MSVLVSQYIWTFGQLRAKIKRYNQTSKKKFSANGYYSEQKCVLRSDLKMTRSFDLNRQIQRVQSLKWEKNGGLRYNSISHHSYSFIFNDKTIHNIVDSRYFLGDIRISSMKLYLKSRTWADGKKFSLILNQNRRNIERDL